MQSSINGDLLFDRYRELQDYVGWTEEDAVRVQAAAPVISPTLSELVEDFYAEIDRHEATRKIITGGLEQVERLKGTLCGWLGELLSGIYDSSYVTRRWKVGYCHVEIGLEQVYVHAAFSRIRSSIIAAVAANWNGSAETIPATVGSLNKLLDLDLAIIEDAYQAEYIDRLQKSERLATLGQVATGIAHELRNPLNAVKTSVYYLQHVGHRTPEKTAEHLGRIDRQVGVANSVISALSDYAKLPTPNLQCVRVREWIGGLLKTHPIPPEIEMSVDCPETLPPMLADPEQLSIAVDNLIRNAVDAMSAGGRLSLRGRHVADTIEMEVIDTGAGIPPEDLGRITEPLYSTKAHGIGLNLAITRAILEKHHGGLRLQSHPGQGTTFTIRLPCCPK